jgi:putative flippase GtrA
MPGSPEPDAVTATNPMLEKWRKQVWSRRLLRFLVVGAGNTAFGYLLYLIGLEAGIPYQVALVGATILGAFINFFTTGQMVFECTAFIKSPALSACMASHSPSISSYCWPIESGMAKTYAQTAMLPVIVTLSFPLDKHLVFGRPS